MVIKKRSCFPASQKDKIGKKNETPPNDDSLRRSIHTYGNSSSSALKNTCKKAKRDFQACISFSILKYGKFDFKRSGDYLIK